MSSEILLLSKLHEAPSTILYPHDRVVISRGGSNAAIPLQVAITSKLDDLKRYNKIKITRLRWFIVKITPSDVTVGFFVVIFDTPMGTILYSNELGTYALEQRALQ